MSASDSLTPKTASRIKYRAARYHTTKVIAQRKAKSYCHGNIPYVQGIDTICTVGQPLKHTQAPLP